jgi:DNA-binding response OmpR family regulator
MSSANLPSHLKINLSTTTVLIIDDNLMSLEILSSVLYGFGAKERMKCPDLEDAKRTLLAYQIDLIILDSGYPDESSFKFMHWLRREAPDPICFVPTIIISGHSTRALVRKARDSGAHFVIAKPITAGVLLNRVAWLAHEKRPFVKHEIFSGPDRRWKNAGVPPGTSGRRDGDLSVEVGEATEGNLSQNQLDAIMKPQKAMI